MRINSSLSWRTPAGFALVRVAYGELGQFGAGQTWSPFMDIDVFPNSLEYWGPKFTENDTGRFAFVFGQGIQNYMNDAPVDVGIELTPGGDPRRPIRGVALPMWSMVAFLDHNWNKRFSTAIGYSFMDIDNSNGQAASAYHRGHYGLGNLLYYPTENVMIGGEFQWGRRKLPGWFQGGRFSHPVFL